MPKGESQKSAHIVGSFVLDAIRINAEILLEMDGASASADVMLTIAIWLGQHEGRPMTAAKLAAFVGMPRPTAIRHLTSLLARGLVMQDGRKRWLIVKDDNGVDTKYQNVILATLQRFHSACAKVSKMDIGAVANR